MDREVDAFLPSVKCSLVENRGIYRPPPPVASSEHDPKFKVQISFIGFIESQEPRYDSSSVLLAYLMAFFLNG
jgi:hypothetical protein